MQRVRIGLTGLAFVFLLVLLSAIFSRATEEEPITPNTLQAGNASTNAPAAKEKDAQPKEPLAQLGVAPGNADPKANETEPVKQGE